VDGSVFGRGAGKLTHYRCLASGTGNSWRVGLPDKWLRSENTPREMSQTRFRKMVGDSETDPFLSRAAHSARLTTAHACVEVNTVSPKRLLTTVTVEDESVSMGDRERRGLRLAPAPSPATSTLTFFSTYGRNTLRPEARFRRSLPIRRIGSLFARHTVYFADSASHRLP